MDAAISLFLSQNCFFTHSHSNHWCVLWSQPQKNKLSEHSRVIFRVQISFQIFYYVRVNLSNPFQHQRAKVYWLLLCSQIFARSQIVSTLFDGFLCAEAQINVAPIFFWQSRKWSPLKRIIWRRRKNKQQIQRLFIRLSHFKLPRLHI